MCLDVLYGFGGKSLFFWRHCGILTGVDSDEPVQPPFKLRNSK